MISRDDVNIKILKFCSRDELRERLNSADIHVVTLKNDWSGISVPSKFFGSLASGKPVIFFGPQDCAISQWIRRFEIGWVAHNDKFSTLMAQLTDLKENNEILNKLKKNAFHAYYNNFSKELSLKKWARLIHEAQKEIK